MARLRAARLGPAETGSSALAPKLALGVFVTLKFAKLNHATVGDAPKVDFLELSALAGTSRTHSAKNKNASPHFSHD